MVKALMILGLSLPLIACQTKPSTVSVIPVQRSVIKQAEPRALSLSQPIFQVVTEKNFDEFKEKYIKDNGNFVMYVITPDEYRKFTKNNAEILRFIKQQKAIIVYYENTL